MYMTDSSFSRRAMMARATTQAVRQKVVNDMNAWHTLCVVCVCVCVAV